MRYIIVYSFVSGNNSDINNKMINKVSKWKRNGDNGGRNGESDSTVKEREFQSNDR